MSNGYVDSNYIDVGYFNPNAIIHVPLLTLNFKLLPSPRDEEDYVDFGYIDDRYITNGEVFGVEVFLQRIHASLALLPLARPSASETHAELLVINSHINEVNVKGNTNLVSDQLNLKLKILDFFIKVYSVRFDKALDLELSTNETTVVTSSKNTPQTIPLNLKTLRPEILHNMTVQPDNAELSLHVNEFGFVTYTVMPEPPLLSISLRDTTVRYGTTNTTDSIAIVSSVNEASISNTEILDVDYIPLNIVLNEFEIQIYTVKPKTPTARFEFLDLEILYDCKFRLDSLTGRFRPNTPEILRDWTVVPQRTELKFSLYKHYVNEYINEIKNQEINLTVCEPSFKLGVTAKPDGVHIDIELNEFKLNTLTIYAQPMSIIAEPISPHVAIRAVYTNVFYNMPVIQSYVPTVAINGEFAYPDVARGGIELKDPMILGISAEYLALPGEIEIKLTVNDFTISTNIIEPKTLDCNFIFEGFHDGKYKYHTIRAGHTFSVLGANGTISVLRPVIQGMRVELELIKMHSSIVELHGGYLSRETQQLKLTVNHPDVSTMPIQDYTYPMTMRLLPIVQNGIIQYRHVADKNHLKFEVLEIQGLPIFRAEPLLIEFKTTSFDYVGDVLDEKVDLQTEGSITVKFGMYTPQFKVNTYVKFAEPITMSSKLNNLRLWDIAYLDIASIGSRLYSAIAQPYRNKRVVSIGDVVFTKPLLWEQNLQNNDFMADLKQTVTGESVLSVKKYREFNKTYSITTGEHSGEKLAIINELKQIVTPSIYNIVFTDGSTERAKFSLLEKPLELTHMYEGSDMYEIIMKVDI